jgi:hypothetical protein
VRDLLSEGSFVVGNISGLPDSPVTDVTFENVAARNNHRGIQCREAQKFHRDFKKWCMNG